jgi:hypothetical protein
MPSCERNGPVRPQQLRPRPSPLEAPPFSPQTRCALTPSRQVPSPSRHASSAEPHPPDRPLQVSLRETCPRLPWSGQHAFAASTSTPEAALFRGSPCTRLPWLKQECWRPRALSCEPGPGEPAGTISRSGARPSRVPATTTAPRRDRPAPPHRPREAVRGVSPNGPSDATVPYAFPYAFPFASRLESRPHDAWRPAHDEEPRPPRRKVLCHGLPAPSTCMTQAPTRLPVGAASAARDVLCRSDLPLRSAGVRRRRRYPGPPRPTGPRRC